MKIGVISDTHNYLDPAIEEVFQGVDHILHAGDVGMPSIQLQLEQIAPVTAVLGNTDASLSLRETEICELGGYSLLVHHIVNPHALSPTLARKLAQIRPDFVVFGHTHRAFQERIGDTVFLNPGYAGKPRPGEPRGVALLELDKPRFQLRFVDL